MKKNAVSTSILSADFLNLGRDIEMINKSETDFIHCDIMDGVFVPNLSFGLPVIKQVSKIAKKPLDVHLMIVHPENYIQAFKDAGASLLTVQYEVCPHLHRTIQSIKKAGMIAGVALNPHTPVSLLEDIICDVDLVLIMSVNPGFGGQKFIENTYSKVKKLKTLIISKKSKCLTEIDGGVNFETGKKLYEAGSDILVSGSFIFNSEDPISTINRFKGL